MTAYRIREDKAEQMVEGTSAFKVMAAYLQKKGKAAPFVLLYTEKDKLPGWEAYYKGPDMFKKPPFSFIERLAA